MEVILLENILNLGNIGDKVSVKNGFGRNFLLKQGKALRIFHILKTTKIEKLLIKVLKLKNDNIGKVSYE